MRTPPTVRFVQFGVGIVALLSAGLAAYVVITLRGLAADARDRDVEDFARRLDLAAAETAILFVILVAAVGIVAASIAGYATSPLHRIIAKVRSFRAGHLDERIPLDGPREHRELAHELNRMAEDLELRQRRLVHEANLSAAGTLLAGVAHEVNNPLTYLVINETLLHEAAVRRRDETPEGPARQRADREVQLSARNLAGLSRLEDLSRSLNELGRTGADAHRGSNVNLLLRGCLVALQDRMMHGADAQLHLDATGLAQGNPRLLTQAFLALLLNALDATGGRGRVTITTRDAEDGVEVDVHDSGPGIPDEVRSHMFQPFFTTKQTRPGLGLSMAVAAVESAGGRIDHVPAAEGARFRVVLPRVDGQARAP